MKFYRYHLKLGTNRLFPILEYTEYSLLKETPNGYWIVPGDSEYYLERSIVIANSVKKWIPKQSKKRFAYPTKKEALDNFIYRTKKRIDFLATDLQAYQRALNVASNLILEEV